MIYKDVGWNIYTHTQNSWISYSYSHAHMVDVVTVTGDTLFFPKMMTEASERCQWLTSLSSPMNAS